MGFDALYGLELTDCSDSMVRARVSVRDELMVVPGSHVHGGVYGAISEALAARGTEAAVASDGRVAVGSRTSRRRCIRSPPARSTRPPSARHRGRTTWVWEVEMSDDEQRRCAVARVTIAVRDP